MKKSPTELITLSFSALMVLLTITGALIFFFTDLFLDRVYGNKRYLLGAIFLFYAVYRSYRMYGVFKSEKRAETQNEEV